jgi:dienelactone hydrolase
MSTKILDYHLIPELQPSFGLWQQYKPELAAFHFNAGNQAEAEAWQAVTRAALREAIGFQDLSPAPPETQLVEEVDKGDYVRQKIILRTWRDALMPVYLLIPKGIETPRPAVLALHGHGIGVKAIVGLSKNGLEHRRPQGYQKDFGVALCRSGFVVAAPEVSCFGERQTDFSYLDKEAGQHDMTTCTHTARLASHLGGSAVGLRVLDGRRLVDYLQTLPFVIPSAIGAMGISGGGLHTFFSTCIDERIRACVVSGYFCTFKMSILAMDHCPCNFVPGLGKFGEMYDLAGLIAPRPMLVESASKDEIFPRPGVEESVDHARKIYEVFGAADQLETDYFEGKHEISGRRAYDFLNEKLGN